MPVSKPTRPNAEIDPKTEAASTLNQFPVFYLKLGRELAAAGKHPEAEACEQKAAALLAELTAESALDPGSIRSLAGLLYASGYAAEATNVYFRLLARQRRQLGDTDPMVGATQFDFAEFLNFDAHDPSAAVEQYLQSLPIRRAKQDAELARTLRNLGDTLLRVGRPREAEPYCRESLEVYRKVHPQDDATTAWVQHLLAQALQAQNKLPEAEALLRQAMKTRLSSAEGFDADLPGVVLRLADVLKSQSKPAEAEALWPDIVRIAERAKDADQAAALYAGALSLLVAGGRPDQVEAIGQKLLAVSPKSPAPFRSSAWSLVTSTNAAAISTKSATVLPIRSCGLLMSLFVTNTQGELSQKLITMTSGSPAAAAEIPVETDVK